MTTISKDGASSDSRIAGLNINAFEAALFVEAEGGFSITSLQFPGVFSEGENRDEAIESIRDAFRLMRDCCADVGQEMDYSPAIEFELNPVEIVKISLDG